MSIHEVERLVEQRVLRLDMLHRTHEGGVFWLNVSLLSSDDVEALYAKDGALHTRAAGYLELGLSIGKLLGSYAPLAQQLRDMLQLFEEHELHCAKPAVQTMKLMMGTSSGPFPNAASVISSQQGLSQRSGDVGELKVDTSDIPAAVHDGTRSGPWAKANGHAPRQPVALHKSGGCAVYEMYWAPRMAFATSAVQTSLVLCTVLIKLYTKLQSMFRASLGDEGDDHTEPGTDTTVLLQQLLKVDERIQHHVMSPMAKKLTELAQQKSHREIARFEQYCSSPQ